MQWRLGCACFHVLLRFGLYTPMLAAVKCACACSDRPRLDLHIQGHGCMPFSLHAYAQAMLMIRQIGRLPSIDAPCVCVLSSGKCSTHSHAVLQAAVGAVLLLPSIALDIQSWRCDSTNNLSLLIRSRR